MIPRPELNANDEKWLLLRARIAEENIKTAFRLFRTHGLEPILIKGWAAAREYPETHLRSFSDIDLAAAPEDFDKARQLIAVGEANKLNIDLHCGLRHLDVKPWQELFENSTTVPLGEVPVRILSAEDHLRVLCVHWLTDGGAHRERLLDIYYLLENRNDSFDWERCLQGIDANRRDWIMKTVAVVCRYYELDITKMQPAMPPLPAIPEWFTEALEKEWSSGTKLRDIHTVSIAQGEIFEQLKRRIRPNPIQATILMEGRLDEGSRIRYQLGSFLRRAKPSMRKGLIRLRHLLKAKK